MAKVCPTCEREYGDDDLYCPADGTTLQPLTPGDDLIGTVVADRYLITDKIGEGGMGRVYLARHVRLPQNVAIKVLHPAMVRDPNVVARFRREVVNASQIENDHVARVFDHGELGDGLFYIAMEFVEGEPLSKIIEREGPIPLPRTVEIIRQVADALAAAHERPTPIVHRDLKPDNIMVGTRRDGTDRVKVVDFGIAEAMSGGGPKLTQQGLVIGTPEYMSPEQLSAITLDWRSDIYSLALVTFDMLTGQLPFTGESPHEAALMRLRDRPRTLAEMKSDVAWPPALQAVIDRALARAPGDRYESAPDYARALAEAAGVSAQPVVATAGSGSTRPMVPTAGEPAQHGRGRSAMMATAAVLGVVVIGAVGYLALTGRPSSPTVETVPVTPTTTAPVADSSPSAATASTSSSAPSSNPKPRSPTPASSKSSGTASPPNAATTTAAPPPTPEPKTAPPAATGTRASVDYVESLIVRARTDTARATTYARAVLDSARAVVPRLEDRDEIVAMGVYTVAAYLLLNQKSEACLVLKSIGGEALAIPKFTEQVRLWNDRLDCKD